MSLTDEIVELRRELVAQGKKVEVLWAAYDDMKKLLIMVLGAVLINIILATIALLSAAGG